MTPSGKRVVLVAAVARNGVIGDGPDIPWRIPGEQATFKQLTLGHTLLMGRTTYESIGRPLPGRTTIVLTRDPSWHAEGVLVAHDLDAALVLAEECAGDVMVAGGAQVYAAAMDAADAQVLTEVPGSPDGDAFYPTRRARAVARGAPRVLRRLRPRLVGPLQRPHHHRLSSRDHRGACSALKFCTHPSASAVMQRCRSGSFTGEPVKLRCRARGALLLDLRGWAFAPRPPAACGNRGLGAAASLGRRALRIA